MARGHIVTVDLPAPPDHSGHEQAGSRPALVVQADPTGASLPTTVIIPMTGQLGAMRFPYTLRIDPSPQNGLTSPSVLLVFQLRAIDRRRLGNEVGRLEQHYMQSLEAEMQRLLGL